MRLKAKIIFKTPFYTPQQQEFYNPVDLTDYMRQLDAFFMRPHKSTHLQVGLPEFQLGFCSEASCDGVSMDSDVKWGPRFLVACDVREDGKRLVVTVPADCIAQDNQNGVIKRQWREVAVAQHTVDAVFDCHNMRQLWPRRERAKTELVRFLTKFARFKSNVKDRCRD